MFPHIFSFLQVVLVVLHVDPLQTTVVVLFLVYFCAFVDIKKNRSEWVPRTRITKRSCACDCGRGPVSAGAFFRSFFFLSSSLTPDSCLKIKIFVGKSDVLWRPEGAPGEEGGRNEKTWKKRKNEKLKKLLKMKMLKKNEKWKE